MPRIKPYRVHQICIALFYGWKVAWIAAATQVGIMTVYRIRTSLDVWGTPYPPPLGAIGRPSALLAAEIEVRNV